MNNHYKAYLQFLLRNKIQDMVENFSERKERIKPKYLSIDNSSNEEPGLVPENNMLDFINDLINNNPLGQIKLQLDFVKKSSIINTQEVYLTALEEISSSNQLILEIATSYLHEFVNDSDVCDQIMYEFESVGDLIDSKIRQSREQFYKKVA